MFKKLLVIGVVVLLLGCGVLGYLLMVKTSDLSETQRELAYTESSLTIIENELLSIEGSLALTRDELVSAQDKLRQTKEILSSTELELSSWKDDYSVLKNELNYLRSIFPPRHFASVAEMAVCLDTICPKVKGDYYIDRLFSLQRLAFDKGYIIDVNVDKKGMAICVAHIDYNSYIDTYWVWDDGYFEFLY